MEVNKGWADVVFVRAAAMMGLTRREEGEVALLGVMSTRRRSRRKRKEEGELLFPPE